MKQIFTLVLVIHLLVMCENQSNHVKIGNEENSKKTTPRKVDLEKFKTNKPKFTEETKPLKESNNAFIRFVKSSKTKFRECSEPSEYYLELLLIQYKKHFRILQEKRYLFSSNENNAQRQNNEDLSLKHALTNSRLVKDSQCDMDVRNITSPNTRSICPWKYVVVENADFYPKTRVMAKCTCSSCMTLENNKLPPFVYKCMPVFKPVPLLKRSDCVNGYFEYVPHTEEVSVACICGLIHNYTPAG